MIPLGRPRPLAIRIFAAAFLAAALLRLAYGLADLPLAETVYAAHLPLIAWDREATIIALSAEFTIALIPLVWIYLLAARFARWLVLGFGALRLVLSDPAGLAGTLLIAISMAALLTPQATRWFARRQEIDPAVFD
ncbi:MAG: hypothetical protein KatS3mg120_2744 [Erythrobacter sp.]|nr:MAG: hypothetical protein KatS3mg120_2744 [Erythrobacter sp.]